MIDREDMITKFIKNFVRKNRQERSFFELMNPKKRSKFYERLNHCWSDLLNMELLKQIDKDNDTQIKIPKLLGFKDDELCYSISNYRDYDDKFIPFYEVFTAVYSRGFATLLINTSADTLFLDTEQEQGPAPRFIGRISSNK